MLQLGVVRIGMEPPYVQFRQSLANSHAICSRKVTQGHTIVTILRSNSVELFTLPSALFPVYYFQIPQIPLQNLCQMLQTSLLIGQDLQGFHVRSQRREYM